MKEEMIKISMPLFDNIELQSIDTFYNDIVDEYTKAYVKEKEQVIIQQIMKNLREENKSLQSQLKEKEEAEREFIKYLEAEKDRLAREVSQIYEDSLGKTKLVNEDIFNEVNNVLSKYEEIIGGKE